MLSLDAALKKYWGYDSFRPLQREAMESVVTGRDSIVVLPTGGGKSLCFQVPAVTMPGMAVVVSPLISLMKDQVDALIECGIPAARLDSSQEFDEQNAIYDQISRGTLKLLYLAPERLVSPDCRAMLRETSVSFIAIDEAHCVSMWGHDFRPEYRELGMLRETFPDIAIHGYTATATEQVRADIGAQLALRNPNLLVGSFDRPNLIYKCQRADSKLRQVREIIDNHPNESGVIYCIRRKDVDALCKQLRDHGYRVAPYHAGMDSEARKKNQDRFIKEKVDVIVATVAFGMGIDKSNVRYVIHTGMPKSLEHYQQESGRAGRDGLEAECHLFYSGGDYGVWKYLMHGMPDAARKVAEQKLNDMYSYCTGVTCRHRALVNYFGQDLEKESCGACDVCLGDVDQMDNGLIVAQKIISCVLRLDERFGADYTAAVLLGSQEKRILEFGHDTLSTYALLNMYTKRVVRDWIEQLVSQGYLTKTGDFNVLNVTDKGRRVLRSDETPCLLQPAKKPAKVARAKTEAWEGVDHGLFEMLRTLRRQISEQHNVPAFIVFGDAALRDMARVKPRTLAEFLTVHGVGESKRDQYGAQFLAVIREYTGS